MALEIENKIREKHGVATRGPQPVTAE